MANPWISHPKIWKTESQFMSYLRGGIRRGLWEKNPIKLEFIKTHRKRVPLGRKTEKNPEGLVWGGECALCNGDFRQADLQVDHKSGNNTLKSLSDLLSFINSIVFVTNDDLQLVCKPCHKIKTHAERKGIDMKEAAIEKRVIKFGKKTVKEQKEFLLDYFPEKDISNEAKRKSCYKELLARGEV